MTNSTTDFRKRAQAVFPKSLIYALDTRPQTTGMLTTHQILTELERRGVAKGEIAKAAGIGNSRVTELYHSIRPPIPGEKPRDTRKLTHDEAVKLVEAFQLELAPETPPLPLEVCRLLALHVARKLGDRVQPDDPRIGELARDLQAFSQFVADPVVRQSIDASLGFFRAMEFRPQQDQSATQPGSDLAPTE